MASLCGYFDSNYIPDIFKQVSPDSHIKIETSGNDSETVFLASQIENSMVNLPDSSIVILQKGSKLLLHPTFGKNGKREVTLTGKAFFDIYHDAKKPFIIFAGDLKTTVLGTSFDIDATSNKGIVKINVIRGKVKVEHNNAGVATLVRNMQIVYEEDIKNTKINSINAEKELAWNKSDLEFNDVSLADAKSKLEEVFGYKIVLMDSDIRNQTFHCSMRSSESVDTLFRSLCEFIGADCKIDHLKKSNPDFKVIF